MTQAVQDRNSKAIVKAGDSKTLKAMVEASKSRIQEIIPKHVDPERLLRVALAAVSRTPMLQNCTANSILQCLVISGQLGLDCSGILGQAYMVPFFNGRVGEMEATLIPGYRGLIDLCRRSGEIVDIYAHVVYRDDLFSIRLGSEPFIEHKPRLDGERTDEQIVGAYMVAELKSGKKHLEWMTRTEIEKVRNGSKGAFDKQGNPKKDSPWFNWFPEMCRKTVIRRGVKQLPISIEMARATDLDDRYDRGEGIERVIDIEGTEIIDTKPPAPASQRLLNKLKATTPTPAPKAPEPPAPPADDSRVPPVEPDDVPHPEDFLPQTEDEAVLQDAAQRAATPKAPENADDVSTWEKAASLINDAFMNWNPLPDPSACDQGINRWLMSKRLKGTPNKSTVEQRKELLAAVRAGTFDLETGKITAPQAA